MDVKVPMLKVQREFFNSQDPFVAIVSSRSCGKSWIAAFSALVDLMMGRNVLFMAQTDGAFYKGAWLHLQEFLKEFNLWPRWSYNSTYKTGKLKIAPGIESKFYYGSYENIDAARGATECSTLYLDEFCLSEPNVLAVTAPCLRGKDNFGHPIHPRIRAVSTPNMQSLWQLMLVEHSKYGITLLRSTMKENVFMTDEQRMLMESAIYDEKMRRQEIFGEILMGEDATAVMALKDFPLEAPYISDDRVYAGLDMAKSGQRDSHCFCAIKGNKLLAFHEFGICDALEVATYIRKFNRAHPIHALNIDLAWSESIFDQLKFEIPCFQRSFAEKPPVDQSDEKDMNAYTYVNLRAYMYFKAARLHRHGLCVEQHSEWIDDGIVAEYKREITNTHFLLDRMGRLLLEPKEDIRVRLGRSPDPADAFCLACLERLESDAPEQRAQHIDTRRKQQQKRYASMMGA